MGNEASQEGEEGVPQQQQPPGAPGRPGPHLVSQQSMPLPPPQVADAPGAGRRGSAGPQLMGRRPSSSGPLGGPSMEKRGSIVDMPEDIDLTNLTEEEKRVIRSVMARAQSLEEDPAKEEEPEKDKCNLCRSYPKECACVECGAQTCKKCSKAIPSGKKHVWMCVPCSEKYPQMRPSARKSDMENHSEGPLDPRRRTSEAGPHAVEERRQRPGMQEGGPPQRGRSESLPGQPPHQMQQQRPQTRPMHPNEGPPFRGMRPDHPQQSPPVRPQHPQPRPRYPVDQQRPQQRGPHPPDQRPQHPGGMPRNQFGPDDHRQGPNHDHVRPQQRPPNPPDQDRSQRPMDQKMPSDQRPQHIPDQQRFPQDQRRPDHPPENNRHPHQTDPKRPPNHFETAQRQPHPAELAQNRTDRPPDQVQVLPQIQGPDDRNNSNKRFQNSHPNGGDYPPNKSYADNNEPPKPKPQHPILHPQNNSSDGIPIYSPQDVPQESQAPQRQLESPQKPPKRNQRLREPPDQQITPRPQHPQQPPQEFAPYSQIKAQHDQQQQPHNDPHLQEKNQREQKHSASKHQQPRNSNNPEVPFDPAVSDRNFPDDPQRPRRDPHHPQASEAYPQFPFSPQRGPQSQQRQSNQKSLAEGEQNDVYVSLSQEVTGNQQLVQGMAGQEVFSAPPPATLPRTKRPEAPQPAGRVTRREKPSASSQGHPRTGTNPFRNDTNPFRRESLPPEFIDAGEYVTVAAPRRGSLDERHRLASNQDQSRLIDAMKGIDTDSKPSSERRLEHQNSFENHKNGVPNTDDIANSNRYLDEEQRRNAINSGVCPPEPSRRQLPNIEHRKHQPPAEQAHPPPIPKARTSLSDSSTYSEGRNGIPRTVPLTSLAQTLEQQPDARVTVARHMDPSDDYASYKTEKNFINDLSQHKQSGGYQGPANQDKKKRCDDLVHPNIVETNVGGGKVDLQRNSGDNVYPQPTNQPRQKTRDQPLHPNQREINDPFSELQGQSAWRDDRKSKPMPPDETFQDLEGYQDEEEEQNIDDYFEMIEKAISRPQQQSIAGGKKSSDIQKQLFGKDLERGHGSGVEFAPQKGQVHRQVDAYNQNQAYQAKNMPGSSSIKDKNDLNMYEPDKILASKKDFYEMDDGDCLRKKDSSQYIIQPTDQRHNTQGASDEHSKQTKDYSGKPYDKLLLHELTPDTRQISAKHYLEEHKTQPVSYEAFSSAKAMQQVQPDQSSAQMQLYPSQTKEGEEVRSQAPYYYSQQTSGAYQQNSQANDNPDPSRNGQAAPNDAQNKKAKTAKTDPPDWSPVSDLSPIQDVSPSVEAAEQELMEKFQEKVVSQEDAEGMLGSEEDPRLLKAGGIPRATGGTISGMLEEFTRALGLPGTSPVDDSGIKSAVSPTSLAMSPITNMSLTSMSSTSSMHKEYQESFGSPQKSGAGGSPQKTSAQPTTPRRSHRRLPQPTVEQMQAAVAMAAQGPRDNSPQPPSTQGAILFELDTKPISSGRPASPSGVAKWSQSFEQAYNSQQNAMQSSADSHNQVTVPSPAPRNSPRAPENGSRALDQNQVVLSGVPQEATPTPQSRRLRSSSYAGNTTSKAADELFARLNGGASMSPHAMGNVFSDIATTSVGSPQTPSTPRDKVAGDSSDTQSEAESIKSVRLRRKLPNLPPDQCSSPSPTRKMMERSGKNGFGEAPDPLEAVFLSSVSPQLVSAPAMTVTTSVPTAVETSKMYSPAPSLAAPSPTPTVGSLSPLLGRRVEVSRTPSPGSDTPGSKLPQYMQNLKQQLRDELKAVTEERKVMLEQRSKEKGEDERPFTPQQPLLAQQPPPPEHKDESINSSASKSLASYQAQQSALMKQMQSQNSFQAHTQVLPQQQIATVLSQKPQPKPLHAFQNPVLGQTAILSPYQVHPQTPRATVPISAYQSQPQMLQYQNQPQMIQYQTQPLTPYKAQVSHYGSQDLMTESGRRTPQPARTPLPDAVPKYSVTRKMSEDDITIMTTATTTVVSASEQWNDPTRKHRQQPPTTTVAPSMPLVGSSVESLRRLQPKMSPQPSPKKGRRRHTSEITMPPFAQMEQMMHYQTLRQQQQQLQQPPMQPQAPPQYIQFYPKPIQQQPMPRSMDFPSIDSHVRANDLLRSSANRYGGSLGSMYSSTEALYQSRRSLNHKIQDYLMQTRAAEPQQRVVVAPDAYFQTLNNEINRLRRSSENLYRDTLYDKPTWGGPVVQQAPPPVPEIRTSPQTTDRRKRKEKKSRKPRSWHPSPYVSEDEDDQMSREEKKVKIKAEIARRRQQIEENMRLHEELCKLAERRDRMESGVMKSGRTTPVAYVPSPTGSVAYRNPPEKSMMPPSRPVDNDDTSSVLKAIDEILRKDLYSGPMARSAAWNTYTPVEAAKSTDFYQSGYVTMPRNRYEYGATPEMRMGGPSWYVEGQQQQAQQVGHFQEASADPETAMDESMARIASTFPTDEPPDILLSATPGHFSPETEVTPAMPLLPDMPTRSRKLLENLGSAPLQAGRSGSAQSLYQDHHMAENEIHEEDSLGSRMQESSTLLRTQRKSGRTPVSKTTQKYDFPVKRILLTRDPKDRSVSGNGLGMKVVGGKEVPGSNGMIGAYVAKIFPGGVVETLGEVKEGDQVLEWNGIPLTGRTYEEVQRIIASSADEVEIVIRCDLNMLETLNRQRRSSPGLGTSGGPRGGGLGPSDTPGSGGPGRGGSPAHSPYSPADSSRGHSPALTKRTMAGGGGGGIVANNMHHALTTNMSQAMSYESVRNSSGRDSGIGSSYGRSIVGRGPISQSMVNVFAPRPMSTDWSELYEPSYFSSPPSPDDYLEDEFESRLRHESSLEQVQLQVCCGPRTAIVYVPILPTRPSLKSAPPAILSRNHYARRSVDHLEEYEPLLKEGWRTASNQTVGFYDLLRPRNSLNKVSLYLNGLREKAEVYELKKKKTSRLLEDREEESRERPRAPSNLPGLRPVFVNDWKRPKKVQIEESDDNNNNSKTSTNQNGSKQRKPNVGSSPDATPYDILPKGCRGSFCVIL